MCFFTFHWMFRKDCLKEKSDVSFMASPPGKKCYRQAPPLSPRIWNVRYRFLQRLKCNNSGTSVSQWRAMTRRRSETKSGIRRVDAFIWLRFFCARATKTQPLNTLCAELDVFSFTPSVHSGRVHVCQSSTKSCFSHFSCFSGEKPRRTCRWGEFMSCYSIIWGSYWRAQDHQQTFDKTGFSPYEPIPHIHRESCSATLQKMENICCI